MEVLLGAVRTQIQMVRRVLPLTYCGSRSLATSIAEGYDMSMLAPPPANPRCELVTSSFPYYPFNALVLFRPFPSRSAPTSVLAARSTHMRSRSTRRTACVHQPGVRACVNVCGVCMPCRREGSAYVALAFPPPLPDLLGNEQTSPCAICRHAYI